MKQIPYKQKLEIAMNPDVIKLWCKQNLIFVVMS